MSDCPKKRRFQLYLSTAIILTFLAGVIIGLSIHYQREWTEQQEHRAIVSRLAARRPNGFDAWDFSSEHMLQGDEQLCIDAWEYVQRPGKAQRIVDDMVLHADDKDRASVLCDLQLVIIMYEFYCQSVNYEKKPPPIHIKRISELAAAVEAEKFESDMAMFPINGDIVREKFGRVFKMANVPLPKSCQRTE